MEVRVTSSRQLRHLFANLFSDFFELLQEKDFYGTAEGGGNGQS